MILACEPFLSFSDDNCTEAMPRLLTDMSGAQISDLAISAEPQSFKRLFPIYLSFSKNNCCLEGVSRRGCLLCESMILACEPFLSFSDDNCTEAMPRLLTDTLSGAQISDLAISAEPQSFKRWFPIYLSFSKNICCLEGVSRWRRPAQRPSRNPCFLPGISVTTKDICACLTFNAQKQTPGLLKTLFYPILTTTMCTEAKGGDC